MRVFTNAIGRWLLTRRGTATVAVALAAALAVARFSSLARALVSFVFLLPLAWLVVWLLAAGWDARTWPATPSWAKPREASPARQLREDSNACIIQDRGGFLLDRRYFFVATGLPPVRLDRDCYVQAERRRRDSPVLVAQAETKRWWWYAETFCWENCGYDARDVQALLRDRERKRERQLERAHVLLNLDEVGP